MTATERLELKAYAFHRMTGLTAPFKDAPPGANENQEERTKEYEQWCKRNSFCIESMLEAFETINK